MATRLVVFDVSGTTVRDAGGIVQRTLRDVITKRGVELRPGALDHVAGLAKLQAIRVVLEGHGRDDLLPAAADMHADFIARMQQYYAQDPSVSQIDGAAATFATLRSRGIAVALDTGFPRVVLDAILARLGWRIGETIDAVIAADEVPRGRPYPDMIDALRHRLGGVDRADTAKVGDTPVDLQEGTMARCGKVIGVLTGQHSREALEAQPHDVIIASVVEVPAVLTNGQP